jgi:hypothetical protein
MILLLAFVVLIAAGCAESAEPASPSPASVAFPTPVIGPSSPLPEKIAAPSVLYKELDIATTFLESAGLVLEVTAETTTADYLPETVLAQQPAPGTLVAPGATISVTVSTPPACDPSYPDLCVAPFGPKLKCADVRPNKNFTVLPPDRQRFDPDRDGVGCEG